jgi:oligosaccharide repeat unit polymerase
MLLSLDILPELLLYSALFGLGYWLLYMRYIYSVVDAQFIFVVTTTFASVLVVEVVEEVRYVWHFFGCQLCVWAGFALVQERTNRPGLVANESTDARFTDKVLLEYTVYALFGIYIISNLIILQSKGFALLSADPSQTKVTNFQQGFGIFRKINWAVGGVTTAGLIFLYLDRQRQRYLTLLLLVIALTALEGSKGALLRFAISFGIFLYHPAFRHSQELLSRLKKLAPLGAIAIFGVFFTVLFKENESSDEVILAFIRRLLYGGDAVLYFYHPINVDFFSRFSPFDYPTYIFNPILGFLRLAPYQEAFGNVMVDNALPQGITLDVIVGPNSSFYTEGQVFFGYYGAFLYSFMLGTLASWLRSMYFSLTKSPAFFLVFLSTIYQFSAAVLVDLKLFITQAFDTILLVLPVYVLVCFITQQKLVFRRITFAKAKTTIN